MLTAGAGVGLAHLSQAVFGGGGAASLTTAVLRESDRRSERQSEREANAFYFLHAADEELRT